MDWNCSTLTVFKWSHGQLIEWGWRWCSSEILPTVPCASCLLPVYTNHMERWQDHWNHWIITRLCTSVLTHFYSSFSKFLRQACWKQHACCSHWQGVHSRSVFLWAYLICPANFKRTEVELISRHVQGQALHVSKGTLAVTVTGSNLAYKFKKGIPTIRNQVLFFKTLFGSLAYVCFKSYVHWSPACVHTASS